MLLPLLLLLQRDFSRSLCTRADMHLLPLGKDSHWYQSLIVGKLLEQRTQPEFMHAAAEGAFTQAWCWQVSSLTSLS